MADIAQLAAQHADLPPEDQKKAGQAIAGKMDDEHNNFVTLILKMLDKKEIDPADPQSFIKQDIYESMPLEWKAKTDQALPNIVGMLRHIVDFRLSTQTPDESPQLTNMIEQLWQMKQRIEEHYDVFKF